MGRALLKAVAPRAMVLLTVSVLALLTACPAEETGPAPNIGATVDAGVRATLEADAKRRATIEAGVAAEVARQRVAEPMPTTTAASTPAPTPAPTATLIPTATSSPLPTAALTPTPEAMDASTLPVSPDACSNGVVVRDPESNPGLVSDCAALIETMEILLGRYQPGLLPESFLNWGAEITIYEWDRVTVDGTPRRVQRLDLRGMGLTGSYRNR